MDSIEAKFRKISSMIFAVLLITGISAVAVLIVMPGVFAQTSEQNSTTEPTVSLEHDSIEIGQPVTWTQTVELVTPDSVAIEVPADAQITDVQTSTGETVDLNSVTTTDTAPADATLVSIPDPQMLQVGADTTLAVINQPAAGYNISFETPAPYTVEEDTSTADLYQKEVTVAHDSALHYTDVKSYSDIPEALVSQGVEFKLFWMVDGVKTDVTSDARFAVSFVDTNGNGISDQMQWTVPQLSEQQFVIEGIILATNADHLDSNRNVVANVYDQIKARDGIWTDPIPAGDYIRVTFEKNLNNTNDITIFAKSDSPDSSIEVYEKDSNVLLANFDSVSQDGMYKILLTNLTGEQNTFDLKIVGNPVEFDNIIDPFNSISATLNGASGVTVSSGASITAAVTVTTVGSGDNNDWQSTGWLILLNTDPAPLNAALTCEDTGDTSASGTFTNSFSITAPAGPGTYNAYFKAFNSNDCSTDNPGRDVQSALFTMTGAVFVGSGVGTVTVTKNVVAPDGTTDVSDSHSFNARLNGANPTTLAEGTDALFLGVSPGTVTITEDSDSNYDLVSILPDSNGGVAGAQVTVVTGQNTVVNVVNKQKQATLTVSKDVIDPDGGAVSDTHPFYVNIDGGTDQAVAEGSDTTFNLDPGTYTLNEGADANYAFVECDVDTDSNTAGCQFTVGSNEQKSITITNQQMKATVTVVKDVLDPDGGPVSDPHSFTADIDGGTSQPIAEGTNAVFVINPGDRLLNEAADSDYDYDSCDADTDTNTAGCQFTVGSNEQKTITITNKQKKAEVTIIKDVLKADGTPVDDTHSFDVDIDGGTTQSVAEGSNAVFNVNPGDRTLNEATDPEYDFDSCDVDTDTNTAGCQFTVGSNEQLSITITNKQKPADLQIIKTGPAYANIGSTITYTLTVTNLGPGHATGVTVTDALPAGVTFVSAPGCSYNSLLNTVNCDLGDMPSSPAAGSTVTILITVTLPNTPGSSTNTATVGGTSIDPNSANNSSSVTTTVLPKVLITNGAAYPGFDKSDDPGRQFNNILTHIDALYYKDTATNPGQFFLYLFYVGQPGSPVSGHLTGILPFPFVTQGAQPIQVYSNAAISGGSVVFTGPTPFTVTGTSTVTPSGALGVALSDYSPKNFGTNLPLNFGGTVPSTGLFMVRVHLDFGLKGTSSYAPNAALDATPIVPNIWKIKNLDNFKFEITGDVIGSQTIQNKNIFKNDRGIFGLVLSSVDSTPQPGVVVELWSSGVGSKKLGETTTDDNGYYIFKVPGKAATYLVKVPSYGKVTSVSVQSNQFAFAQFLVP